MLDASLRTPLTASLQRVSVGPPQTTCKDLVGAVSNLCHNRDPGQQLAVNMGFDLEFNLDIVEISEKFRKYLCHSESV